jgi:hypothetical protein
MSIIGFNINKIHAERKKTSEGKININNNVSIVNVHDSSISLGGNEQNTIQVEFKFVSTYEPDVGQVLMEGDVLWLIDKNQAGDIMKGWAKTKTLPDVIMRTVLNHILMKCNIEALILSRDINLPPPIPLPKIDKGPEDTVPASESKEQKKLEKPSDRKK